MPVYGPWIQADDYDAGFSFSPYDSGYVHADTPRTGVGEIQYRVPGGPWQELTPGDILAATTEALATPAAEASGFSRANVITQWVYGIDGTVLDDWVSTALATINYRPAPVSPYTNFANLYSPWEDMPANAIGWQWESDGSTWTEEEEGEFSKTATAVSLRLKAGTELTAHNADNSFTPSQGPGAFTTDVLVSGTGTFLYDSGTGRDVLTGWGSPGVGDTVATVDHAGTTAGAVTTTLGSDVDLTAAMDADGRAVVFTVPSTQLAPNGDMTSAGGVPGDTFTYGFTIEDAIVEWTFHPPRFRWILNVRTPAPPLRRRQRDDGAISAPRRNSGRMASQQRSLRNRGYL